MKSEKISELTTNRLSVYLRCLNTLSTAGIKSISSQALAEQFNLNSAQIRKDLGYFGEFGVRGLGYHVEDLRQHITKILGLETLHDFSLSVLFDNRVVGPGLSQLYAMASTWLDLPELQQLVAGETPVYPYQHLVYASAPGQ